MKYWFISFIQPFLDPKFPQLSTKDLTEIIFQSSQSFFQILEKLPKIRKITVNMSDHEIHFRVKYETINRYILKIPTLKAYNKKNENQKVRGI